MNRRGIRTPLHTLKYSLEVEVDFRRRATVAHAWLLAGTYDYEESYEHTILVSSRQNVVAP
jgi:hypothetical protein